MSEPFIQSPRASSHTRDSDITITPWPVVTRSLLADHDKLAASHDPSQINQPLFALIRARKAIGDARLACLFAKRLYVHADKPELLERLTQVAAALEAVHTAFPLTILENAKNHPRRHITAGHDGASTSTPWSVE
jgi:hypothetical protein